MLKYTTDFRFLKIGGNLFSHLCYTYKIKIQKQQKKTKKVS